MAVARVGSHATVVIRKGGKFTAAMDDAGSPPSYWLNVASLEVRVEAWVPFRASPSRASQRGTNSPARDKQRQFGIWHMHWT